MWICDREEFSIRKCAVPHVALSSIGPLNTQMSSSAVGNVVERGSRYTNVLIRMRKSHREGLSIRKRSHPYEKKSSRRFIKHGRHCSFIFSVFEKGSQQRKEPHFILFRAREGLSTTEGSTFRSLPCSRRALNYGTSQIFVLFRARKKFSTTEEGALYYFPHQKKHSTRKSPAYSFLSSTRCIANALVQSASQVNRILITQTSSIDEFLYPIYNNSKQNLLIPSVLVESLDKFPLIRRMIFCCPFVFMTKNFPRSVVR